MRKKIGIRVMLYMLALILAGLAVWETVYEYFPAPLEGVLYGGAAVIVAASCYCLFQDISNGIKGKLKPRVESNYFANKVFKDYRYRTVLFTFPSLIMNLFYAAGNCIYGILNYSVWFLTLAVYYAVLSVMRFYTVRYEYKVSGQEQTEAVKKKELIICRRCGVLFLFLSTVVGGTVILIVHLDKGRSYSGSLIFAAAFYTFYKIIVSIINVIKARRLKVPLLMTIRNIGYADAMVSLLSLQTAMLASFGNGKVVYMKQMNSITGGVLCLMIFFMGVRMLQMRVIIDQ